MFDTVVVLYFKKNKEVRFMYYKNIAAAEIEQRTNKLINAL